MRGSVVCIRVQWECMAGASGLGDARGRIHQMIRPLTIALFTKRATGTMAIIA